MLVFVEAFFKSLSRIPPLAFELTSIKNSVSLSLAFNIASEDVTKEWFVSVVCVRITALVPAEVFLVVVLIQVLVVNVFVLA